MKRKFLNIILRYVLSKYYGLDRMVLMKHRYWPERYDAFNLLDFVLTNHYQNCVFPINVGGKGLTITGNGQCGHYYRWLDQIGEPLSLNRELVFSTIQKIKQKPIKKMVIDKPYKLG